MDRLPPEILLKIFQHLDPLALENTLSTCRYFYSLVDESVWREAFYNHCVAGGHGIIPRIRPTWKRESLLRTRIRRDFHRGRGKIFTVQPKIGESSSLYYDSKQHRVIFASEETGQGVVIDAASGKIAARDRLVPGLTPNALQDVCLAQAINNGLVYGFSNGSVAIVTLDAASGHWQFNKFSSLHSGPVSACAFDGDLLVTGDRRGELKCWNSKSLQPVKTLQTSLPDIVAIHYDNDSLTVLDRILEFESDLQWAAERPAAVECFSMPDMTSTTRGLVSQLDSIVTQAVYIGRQRILLMDVVGVAPNPPVYAIQDFSLPGHPITVCKRSTTHNNNDAAAIGPPGPIHRFAVLGAGADIDIFDGSDPAIPVVVCNGDSNPEDPSPGSYNGVTCIALSHTIVAVGRYDGSVLAYDALTGEPMRPLFKRVTKRFDTVNDRDGNPFVRDIQLHPYLPQGVVNYRYEVVCFNFDPNQSDKANGKRKPLRQKVSLGSPSSRAGVAAAIQQEVQQLTEEDEIAAQDERRVRRLAGDLSLELNEEELLAYTGMLSQQDGDVDEALRQSLADAALEDRQQAESARWSREEMDLALALSLP